MKPVAFETEGTFTIRGRPLDGHGAERITGTVLSLPPVVATHGTIEVTVRGTVPTE